MKTELIEILNELEEVIKDKYKLTDFEKMDIAVRIYNSQSINKQKQFYPKPYPKKEFRNDFSKTSPLTSKDELPTESQLKEAKRLGLTIPAGSSKQDVWKIIKEFKENE